MKIIEKSKYCKSYPYQHYHNKIFLGHLVHYSSGLLSSTQIQRERIRRNRSHIEWRMQEMYHRLVKGERDKEIMRALLLSERNYYKYKKKLATRLEERQKETMESTIWLDVQTLKDRMSQLYSVLAERVKDPYTKTSELPNLAATAESIAINILKLESTSITAIKQSNMLLENHIKTQLPSSRSKYQPELPKIIYNNNISESDNLEKNNIMIYND
jgi:hypothetical protein